MGLKKYFVKRAIYYIVMLFLAIVAQFIIFRLMPGNPIILLVPPERMSPEEAQRMMAYYGLDKPMYEQFAIYLVNLLTGRFGISLQTKRNISDDIFIMMKNTLILGIPATIISLILGWFIGLYTASKQGSKRDALITGGSTTLYSIPTFWLALIFLTVFAFRLSWFPMAGTIDRPPPTDPFLLFVNILWHATLPLTTMVIITTAGLVLVMRNVAIDEFNQDYILLARAKGISNRTILLKHVLRNAILPMITMAALQFGFILSGTLLVEIVFSWNGMGMYIYNAVIRRDYPVLQAVFFLIAASVLLANFIADILYAYADPRIRV